MSDDVPSFDPPIRIVLVGTQHPGNIGSAARAMKTMGLTRLVLVAPEKAPDRDTVAMSAGADDLVAAAPVFATLAEAVDLAGVVHAVLFHHVQSVEAVHVPQQHVAGGACGLDHDRDGGLLHGGGLRRGSRSLTFAP